MVWRRGILLALTSKCVYSDVKSASPLMANQSAPSGKRQQLHGLQGQMWVGILSKIWSHGTPIGLLWFVNENHPLEFIDHKQDLPSLQSDTLVRIVNLWNIKCLVLISSIYWCWTDIKNIKKWLQNVSFQSSTRPCLGVMSRFLSRALAVSELLQVLLGFFCWGSFWFQEIKPVG